MCARNPACMSNQLLIDQTAGERPVSLCPEVDLVIPVYNEQHVLQSSVRTLDAYMSSAFRLRHRITIADNASTDATLAVAEQLAAELPAVQVRHLAAKGRGRALREAWLASDADVVGYMDVDLSTDLGALPALLAPLLEERADIAIGTRLAARLAGHAQPQARADLALLQHPAAGRARGRLLRRPVRLQGRAA